MRLEVRDEARLLQQKDAPSILIVDDESIIRDLCARALRDYRILHADNGQEALRLLENEPIDLLLVDVMMPIMNGLDLLQQVKDRDPEQLVIIMTGYADKDVILRALKSHADDFIQKPINLLQLKTSIENALEKKNLRQELLQVKQLDRIKSDFLGLVSHKLRTPTTSISLFIQNLASSNFDPTDPGFIAAVAAIREESDYLAYLIEDLLYFSDVILQDKRGTIALANLKEVATTVLAEKRRVAEQKQLILESDFSGDWVDIMIDRVRISFAMNALLDNAIKFTPPGGKVIFSGEVSSQDILLKVTDNGPGIPEDELPKVFDKFYQVDPHNTGQIRGFGLGLFYARQFIREHGGTIEINSIPGKGTEAIIQLPRLLLEPGD